MRFLLALILVWVISSSAFACEDKDFSQSWLYVLDTNTCLRVWGDGGEFPTYQDCLKSRAGKVRFIWGAKTVGTLFSWSFSRFSSWASSNASEGLLAERLHFSLLQGIQFLPLTEFSDYRGSNITTSPISLQDIKSVEDEVLVRNYNFSRGSYFRYNQPYGADNWDDGVNESIYLSIAWFRSLFFDSSVNPEEIYKRYYQIQDCSAEKYFTSRLTVTPFQNQTCSDVSFDKYLVDTEYSRCIGGVCPSIDSNLQHRPPCRPPDDGGDPGDPDFDEDEDNECDLDNLNCLKNAFNSIFPFDIFALPADLSLICPALVFFGYPWDLCWAYELFRWLKYPIVVSLSIKLWLWL